MKHTSCPHCGCNIADTKRESDAISFIALTGHVHYRGRSARLTPVQMDIFERLFDAWPHAVDIGELEDIVEAASRRANRSDIGDRTHVFLSQVRGAFQKAGMEIDIRCVRKTYPSRYALFLPQTQGGIGWGVSGLLPGEKGEGESPKMGAGV